MTDPPISGVRTSRWAESWEAATRERYQCDEKECIVVEREYVNIRHNHEDFDEIRYLFYINTRDNLSANVVVRCANQHAALRRTLSKS